MGWLFDLGAHGDGSQVAQTATANMNCQHTKKHRSFRRPREFLRPTLLLGTLPVPAPGTMLTRTEETDSDESSGTAADRRPAVAGDGGSDSLSNLQTVLSDELPDEPWAIVSLGGRDLQDTAIANNLSGLDLNSINQESGVSSLSGTNGVALDGQTILSSLGPDADDEDDDAIDGLLLPGPNPASTGSVTGENDDLSIPDTVPSNIRSIRDVGAVNATTTCHTSSPDQHNRKRDTIVLVSFAVLFMGVTVLASTWRRSALRLEAELAELRTLKKVEGRNANVATLTGGAQTNAPPLFGDREEEEEATPFTFADNCYIKAKASVSLGSCGSEMRDNLHNASSKIRKRFKSFSRKFEEAFWSFGNDDGGDHDGNNSTGTFFSSSSFFSTSRPRPHNTAGSTSQIFPGFNKLWEAKRNCWNKASKRFASDLNAFASRASESVHQTLNQSNKAIEHGIWSFIDHTRDAIEEGTSALREIKHDEGEEVSDPSRGDEVNLMESFRIIFSNITSVRGIAREFPSLGSAK